MSLLQGLAVRSGSQAPMSRAANTTEFDICHGAIHEELCRLQQALQRTWSLAEATVLLPGVAMECR